jgi:hypothetical protein
MGFSEQLLQIEPVEFCERQPLLLRSQGLGLDRA